MSPRIKKHYEEKYRKVAFYIAQNDKYRDESPPEVSFILGLEDLDKKASTRAKYNGPKDAEDRIRPHVMSAAQGRRQRRKPTIKCPSLSHIWDSNVGYGIAHVF